MAKNTRTKGQREKDKILITKMYLEGHRLSDIASEIGVTYQTIQDVLKRLIKEWQTQAIKNIDELKAVELERINKLEVRAWKALEDSDGKVKKVVEKVGSLREALMNHALDPHADNEDPNKVNLDVETTTTIEKQVADPRYMKIILDCIKTRCQILGIETEDKEKENDKTPPVFTINVINPVNNDSRSS